MKVLVIMQISSETTTFDAGAWWQEWYCTMRSHCEGDAKWEAYRTTDDFDAWTVKRKNCQLARFKSNQSLPTVLLYCLFW